MAIIKYYLGAEKHEIKEVEGFEYSIFGEQYAQAIKQIAHLLKSPMDDAPNLLAFCGDRGEGKSSCMRSVSYIIENVGEKKEIKEYVSKITNEDLSRYHFDVLPIIDPAFFDKNHNVLELVLGQLYSNFKDWVNKNGSNEGFMSRNKVAKSFQEAKLCLRYLNKGQEEMYDPLEELESLSGEAGLSVERSFSETVFFDTELIVTKVWFDYAFGRVPEWLNENIHRFPMDVYLLTYPDLPWIPDPARSNGSDTIRLELFQRYEAEIQALDIPYYIIKHS